MRILSYLAQFCFGGDVPKCVNRRFLGCLLSLIVVGLTACSTVRAPSEHVVLVDRSGNPLNPGRPGAYKASESPTNFEHHVAMITNAIANCTNCVAPDGTRRILIFVHGGLNTFNQSLARVNEIIPHVSTNNYYPLFINWDSGMKSSYLQHLFLVRQGEVQRVWGPLTFPLYLAADLGRAVTRAPVVWYHQFSSDTTTVARYESPNWRGRAKEKIRRRASTSENGLRLSIGSDERSGWSKFGYGVSYVLTFPFKLATGPFVDAFGKSAWDNMSRRTQTMFRNEAEFKSVDTTNEVKVARQRVGSPAQGAVARLMQSLDSLTRPYGTNRYSITLIGHSMGTIVANEMVLTYPQLPYSNIVYMGAACTISDFQKAVVPYLARATNSHFYNLTLHPVAEAREAQWSWLDLTPRGSLLEWIDNFLSTPRTIPERTLGKWDNIVSTTALIPKNVGSRMRIKAFAVGSKDKVSPNNPLVHGEFSEGPFWEEPFWTKWEP